MPPSLSASPFARTASSEIAAHLLARFGEVPRFVASEFQVTRDDVAETLKGHILPLQEPFLRRGWVTIWDEICTPSVRGEASLVHEVVEARLFKKAGVVLAAIEPFAARQQAFYSHLSFHYRALYEECRYIQQRLIRDWACFVEIGELIALDLDFNEDLINEALQHLKAFHVPFGEPDRREPLKTAARIIYGESLD